MKKILAIFAFLLLIISFIGCNYDPQRVNVTPPFDRTPCKAPMPTHSASWVTPFYPDEPPIVPGTNPNYIPNFPFTTPSHGDIANPERISADNYNKVPPDFSAPTLEDYNFKLSDGYLLTEDSDSKLFILKYDFSGNVVWRKPFINIPDFGNVDFNIYVLQDDSFVISSQFQTYNAQSNPKEETHIIKSDAAGDILWTYTVKNKVHNVFEFDNKDLLVVVSTVPNSDPYSSAYSYTPITMSMKKFNKDGELIKNIAINCPNLVSVNSSHIMNNKSIFFSVGIMTDARYESMTMATDFDGNEKWSLKLNFPTSDFAVHNSDIYVLDSEEVTLYKINGETGTFDYTKPLPNYPTTIHSVCDKGIFISLYNTIFLIANDASTTLMIEYADYSSITVDRIICYDEYFIVCSTIYDVSYVEDDYMYEYYEIEYERLYVVYSCFDYSKNMLWQNIIIQQTFN